MMQRKVGHCWSTLLLRIYPSVLYLSILETSVFGTPENVDPSACKPGVPSGQTQGLHWWRVAPIAHLIILDHGQARLPACRAVPGHSSPSLGRTVPVLVGKQWLECREGVRVGCLWADSVDFSAGVSAHSGDYISYDGALGLCLCHTLAGGSECGGWCRSVAAQPLQLVCAGELQLLHIDTGNQVSVSGSRLEATLKRWDSQGALECGRHLNFSCSLYMVQTSGNLSDEAVEEDKSHWSRRSGVGDKNSTRAGILNPTTCLQRGNILLFTVTREHYPQYDTENLYNTNAGFDWGSFRHLADEMTQTKTPPSLFPVIFTEPGVYTLRLSSNQFKCMYVKVMPMGGQCYEVGPFFPTVSHHLTRLGIARRRHLLLKPDWLVIGGLMVGTAIILSMCVAFLILFREYGWPEKVVIRPRYRALQLTYSLDDYSSKGSQVTAIKKHHRCLQAGGTEETNQPELYQRVLRKVGALNLGQWAVNGGMKEGYKDLRKEVEKEQARRKTLAAQLGQLLDSQLQVLRADLRSQREVHKDFGARLKEALRLLDQVSKGTGQLWDKHHEHALQRVSILAAQMIELVSGECQRQGAWGVLGQGTGARLLCPERGVVLNPAEIVGPDGTIRAFDAVHVDSCTGLVLPNPGAQMRLASGHSMPVPLDFFLHSVTGRLLPMAGNVGYDPMSSTLVFTADSGGGETSKWESPLLPFVPYPRSRHTEQHMASRLRGLRPGQRMVLGGPMNDPDTGMLVPILAVTIHPQTGLVYPLGGVHVCPFTRLSLPIQIGSPILDPRTGNVVLTTGVCLDNSTGGVVPVGGLLLAESFLEPLSGQMARVGGASLRGGKLVPHAGGFQTLLDAQTLGARMRAAQVLHGCRNGMAAEPEAVRSAAAEVEQAWRSSQHCLLQLIGRFETLLEWAWDVAQEGGTQGMIQLPGSELSLPALIGQEYPDPGGSGLWVPVLGVELDLETGRSIPLAGTMEDADGKGLVAIRIGARTVDPVTRTVGAVVGARLDALRQTVVPVTVSSSLSTTDNVDRTQVDILQREWCMRNAYWRQQRQKEEDLLTDLHTSVQRCLYAVLQSGTDLEHWADRERQLREAVTELHEAAQAEVQRRAAQRSELLALLPPHVLLLLTTDDELEWEQQCWWWAELGAGLDRVGAGVDRLQQERDRCMAQGWEEVARLHGTKMEARLRELWDELNSRQTELEAALTAQLCLREHCQLRADTAQALRGCRISQKAMGMNQHRVLPVLQKLMHLLEEHKQTGMLSSTHCWQSSGMSAQSVKDPLGRAPSQDLEGSTRPSAPQVSPPHTQRKEVQLQKEMTQYICVPVLS
ncbi:hypothetical protein JZ751_002310, partial [Albula glossodonta]